MTLEQYLRDYLKRNVIDFDLRVVVDAKGKVGFYIHPEGRDGTTIDFTVQGDKAVVGGVFE